MLRQTLYFGNPAKLSVKYDQLQISLESAPPGFNTDLITRPIEDIGLVIIDSPQITVTAPVLERLMAHGAAVIVCNQRHLPSGLMLNLEGHSLQAERFRIHLEASLPLKKQLWQQTVIAKIRNQAAVLGNRESKECSNMLAWSAKVKSGDPENLEARAAIFYWRNLLKHFPDVRRDREGPEPNSMLNYGYAIVRAIIARALISSGMHPSLGIHHRNKYNAYCLADDIMEPYRPYVDNLVLGITDKRKDATISDKETKRQILAIPTIDVEINGIRRPLMVAAADTAASLFKCFEGKCRKIKYPEIKFTQNGCNSRQV